MDSSSSSLVNFSALLPGTQVDEMVRQWLNDDMPSLDVGGLVVGMEEKTAQLWMKSSGVFAGKPFFNAVFDHLNCTVEWEDEAVEGNLIDASSSKKICLAKVKGPVALILRGERTALNILSRCSGVATASFDVASIIRQARGEETPWKGMVAGTRKTTPGFRLVEKYGLLVGGAATHRLDLSQMVMLKDNHIWSAGSIANAVKLAKRAAGFSQKIEVECQSLDEALEAAEAGADVVMLDNFTPIQIKHDAPIIKTKYPHVLIEASGGITKDTITEYVCDHVDVISQGSLTQGYDCLDFSLKIVH